MSDSDSSLLSSARSDILEGPTPVPAPALNGTKKRKRDNPAQESAGAAPKKSRTKSDEDIGGSARKANKSAQKSPRGATKKTKVEVKEEVDVKTASAKPKSTSKNIRKSTKEVVKVKEEDDGTAKVKVKIQRKRKTKEEKEAEAMPLATRTLGAKVLVGAHVSSAGGVHNAVMNSIHIGGNAFALFLKSQRKWENPPLQDEHLSGFMSACKEHKYGHRDHDIPPIVPHGSYVVSLLNVSTR